MKQNVNFQEKMKQLCEKILKNWEKLKKNVENAERSEMPIDNK